MSSVFLLIPLSLLLLGLGVWAFFWAVNSGQFDDLEQEGLRPLEDDGPAARPRSCSGEPPGFSRAE